MAAKKSTVTPVLKIKKLNDNAKIPERKTEGSVGLDLCVTSSERIYPTTTTSQAYKINTGIALEIPEGYHGKIFLRSSTGLKRKLRLANGTGIIDSDYRGEIILLIENVGYHYEHLYEGERIAQLIIEKNAEFDLEVVTDDELSPTERGEGGLGSTNEDV